MRKSHVFAGLSLLVLQLACGDDSVTPTSATLCAHLCARVHEAKCAGEANTDCQATCLQQIADTPASCTALVDSFATCAGQNVFTCDSKNEASPPVACMQQLAAWEACEAQSPSVDAGKPSQGTGGDASTTPVPVVDSGIIHEPAGGDAGTLNPGHLFEDAAASNGDGSVSGAGDAGALPEICRPALNDDSCDTCGETSCCAELAGCNTECRTLGVCVSECADGNSACIQACGAAANQTALDQYNAILDCYESKCAAPCGA